MEKRAQLLNNKILELQAYEYKIDEKISILNGKKNNIKNQKRQLNDIITIILGDEKIDEKVIEKIKNTFEPEEDELLPDNIKDCHEIIIKLRQIIRRRG
jgi:hypothetical protein